MDLEGELGREDVKDRTSGYYSKGWISCLAASAGRRKVDLGRLVFDLGQDGSVDGERGSRQVAMA